MRLKIAGAGNNRHAMRLFTEHGNQILGVDNIKWETEPNSVTATTKAQIEFDSSEVAFNIDPLNYFTPNSQPIPLTTDGETRLRIARVVQHGFLTMSAHDDQIIDNVDKIEWEKNALILTINDVILEMTFDPTGSSTPQTSTSSSSSTSSNSNSGPPSAWYGGAGYGGGYGPTPTCPPPDQSQPPDASMQQYMDFDSGDGSVNNSCNHVWHDRVKREWCSKCGIYRDKP